MEASEQWEELQKKYWLKMAPIREMLNSQVGQQFIHELRNRALNPKDGLYVQGSFDRTAFNLGALALVAEIDDLARGPRNER
jgi:hypothetical protein